MDELSQIMAEYFPEGCMTTVVHTEPTQVSCFSDAYLRLLLDGERGIYGDAEALFGNEVRIPPGTIPVVVVKLERTCPRDLSASELHASVERGEEEQYTFKTYFFNEATLRIVFMEFLGRVLGRVSYDDRIMRSDQEAGGVYLVAPGRKDECIVLTFFGLFQLPGSDVVRSPTAVA